ncbi:hypothetical protein LX32DRAFT_436042 [Colletotrichum zoysiae]|uniref:Uncharacterized protein n=1 Tax=Colletotrichum zoysiae TaxID=1216348 RepID=A0AAD9HG39_9PEZI|nr:hypothetical protein LX32DRAFT_436042 [Colletotrichum zoysiae]
MGAVLAYPSSSSSSSSCCSRDGLGRGVSRYPSLAAKPLRPRPPPRSPAVSSVPPKLPQELREPSASPSSRTEGRDMDAGAVEGVVSYGGGGASSPGSRHRSWCRCSCWSSSSASTGTVCRWTSCAIRPGTCAANAAPFFDGSIVATPPFLIRKKVSKMIKKNWFAASVGSRDADRGEMEPVEMPVRSPTNKAVNVRNEMFAKRFHQLMNVACFSPLSF